MIRPFRFIWKQLNGPQITAFISACYEWCIRQFDTSFEYFNNLNITTANSYHLSLMGICASFSRPYIRVIDKAFFWFTEEPQANFDHGFSSLENLSKGGLFSDLVKVWESEKGIPLSDAFFRVVLQSYATSKGEIGSLTLIDDLCYALQQYVGTPGNNYIFNILTEIEENRDVGDIFIDLGAMGAWENWESVVAALQALTGTTYAPLPRVWVGYTS